MNEPRRRSIRIGELDIAYAEGGDGGAPHRVLFVHGIPTSSHLYRNVQAALGPTFHTIAPDLPGYGRSSKPRGYDYSLENLARDLGAFKRATYGTEPVHLVIHDIGGPVGLGWALAHLGEVRTLTILNTTVFLERFRPPKIALLGLIPFVGKRMIQRTPTKVLRRGLKAEFRLRIAREDLDGYIAPFAGSEGEDAKAAMAATFAAYSRGLGFLQRLRRGLRAIEVPTQIIFGGADRYCTPPNGAAFAEAIPHATFEVLDGVGHFIAEEVPELVAERVAALATKGTHP